MATRGVPGIEHVERFVEASAITCEDVLQFETIDRCAIALHSEAGPPILLVDNFPDASDEYRLRAGPTCMNWELNPLFAMLRQRLGPIGMERMVAEAILPLSRAHGYTGRDFSGGAVPLIGPSGWFATLMYGGDAGLPIQAERELGMIASRLVAWCASRGIGAVPDLPKLSARQFEIARLASSSMSNAEIADALEISVNTVKVRLKQIFERLDVESRQELDRRVRRVSPLDGVPIGVSRIREAKATRGDHAASWVPG